MSETASEQGMVDEAQKVLEEAEALKKLTPRQEPAVDPTKYTAADVRIVKFLYYKTDQRRGAESENQVKRETEEIAVTVEEILTVEVEIVTGIMTTVNMTDTITSHVAMTHEAGVVRVPCLGKDQEIMIAADAMTATKMLQEMVAARGRYRCV
ncbi:hypothetical protein IGI04_009455 [Brassica rapa subsp. trilocularis]|uniref:Uncharacterized protein n=1 Tax=Brassica rapa subsp. trilocularis TaxID=1813537 RepID=A0ABQ7MXB1_BRACM|nr:hypothetical protein IGI04_009455 [Brassica rapa subsp. trilocularis]